MDTIPTLALSIAVFVSVGSLAYAVAQAAGRHRRIRRRHGLLVEAAAGLAPGDLPAGARPWIDPARFGLDARALRAVRSELLRAGLFGSDAPGNYMAVRLALLVALPVFGVLVIPVLFGVWGILERAVLALVLLAVAYALPKAYVSRRRRRLEADYELTFPNFVDMLVVCVNAGLGLEASLVRAGRELGDDDRAFRGHLDMMLHETRAGKSLPDALAAFADRLGIREAASFAGLLSQTIELGTDLAAALTTFADEMRDKRMSKAEEKAAALPPKLTLPLGLFIFPVVLVTILAPAVLKVMGVLGR